MFFIRLPSKWHLYCINHGYIGRTRIIGTDASGMNADGPIADVPQFSHVLPDTHPLLESLRNHGDSKPVVWLGVPMNWKENLATDLQRPEVKRTVPQATYRNPAPNSAPAPWSWSASPPTRKGFHLKPAPLEAILDPHSNASVQSSSLSGCTKPWGW